MQHIKGPDFPTGGVILGLTGIRDAYETGRGRVRVRARAHIEQLRGNARRSSSPSCRSWSRRAATAASSSKIAELVNEKKITEISDLADDSDRNGMRIVIELKRDANPKVVLNKLYKHTPMQTTFGVNMVALVDNVPRSCCRCARSSTTTSSTSARSSSAAPSTSCARSSARVHRLEGLLIALDHLDEVIALIRASRDRDAARTGLMERFELTHIQAQAILDLRLQQLTALEADALRKEHADKMERIRELRELLGDEDMVLDADQDRAARDLRALRRRAPHGDRARPRTTSTSRT